MRQLAVREVETSLLGCFLQDPSLIDVAKVQPDHFSSTANKMVYEAMQELSKESEPIDTVTIITKITPDNLSKIGGMDVINRLQHVSADPDNYRSYEKHIYESWKVRQAKLLQQKKITSLQDITELKDQLSNLETNTDDDEYDHKQSLIELHKEIESQTEGLSGYDTGFRDLNRYLDGFHGGELIVVAARPSVGKTAKMLNHARKHCENGGISVIFSLEMPTKQLQLRMLSSIGNIDGGKMRNPKSYFNDEDWDRYHKAIGIFSNYHIYIDDTSGQTVSHIRSKVRQIRNDYPGKEILVMIDYLQLMRTDKQYENKNIEVGEITRSLKELARNEDVPVYLLSQLSRGVEQRQDKRPVNSDIRDSGSVEQDADVIMFLYRDDYYDNETDQQNIIEVIISKQRNGPVGTVSLAYIREYNLFLDLEYRYDD